MSSRALSFPIHMTCVTGRPEQGVHSCHFAHHAAAFRETVLLQIPRQAPGSLEVLPQSAPRRAVVVFFLIRTKGTINSLRLGLAQPLGLCSRLVDRQEGGDPPSTPQSTARAILVTVIWARSGLVACGKEERREDAKNTEARLR